MAKKSSTKQRSQGGGRKSNSEPRIQAFTQFAGVNFQFSPRGFFNSSGELLNNVGDDRPYSSAYEPEQSDLQMNYFTIQNNVAVVDNKTLETMQPIEKVFDLPDDVEDGETFSGVAKMIDRFFFAATTTGRLHWWDTIQGDDGWFSVTNNVTNETTQEWTDIGLVSNNLIVLSNTNTGTTENPAYGMIWSADFNYIKSRYDNCFTIENAAQIKQPEALTFSNFTAKGDLTISETVSDDTAYRVGVRYTYVNKYGPTTASDMYTFYASAAVNEWHSGQYIVISGTFPSGKNIEAIELYYVTDTASEAAFLNRIDVDDSISTDWTFAWTGYLTDTSMWTIANLTVPDANYTTGPHATRLTTIDGRAYFWGNQEHLMNENWRLYIGGNPGNELSLSTGTGGGYADVEPGTGQEIRVVTKYKTQSGNSIVTMLCDSPNSQTEQRYNLVENNVTLSNEQSAKSWQAEQVSGSVGCKSYDGAIVCEDGLYAISRYGVALTTLTMEYNSQIKVNYISDPIKPAFVSQRSTRFKNSMLYYVNGVIYLCFGKDTDDLGHAAHPKAIDNVLFCYDVGLKTWWTATIPTDLSVLSLTHIDYEGNKEGVGIVTSNAVYLLPTTEDPLGEPESAESVAVDFLIESAELATQVPQQVFQRLVQIEFRFDRFIGDIKIELIGIDQLGRRVTTVKNISHDTEVYDLAEWMRVDLTLQSYKLRFSGKARFRLTHFMSKVYTLSSRIGLVYGFDDRQSSFSKENSIHPYFKNYNDIRDALIP